MVSVTHRCPAIWARSGWEFFRVSFFRSPPASIQIQNDLDTRSKEFGTILPLAVVPGTRSVSMTLRVVRPGRSGHHRALPGREAAVADQRDVPAGTSARSADGYLSEKSGAQRAGIRRFRQTAAVEVHATRGRRAPRKTKSWWRSDDKRIFLQQRELGQQESGRIAGAPRRRVCDRANDIRAPDRTDAAGSDLGGPAGVFRSRTRREERHGGQPSGSRDRPALCSLGPRRNSRAGAGRCSRDGRVADRERPGRIVSGSAVGCQSRVRVDGERKKKLIVAFHFQFSRTGPGGIAGAAGSTAWKRSAGAGFCPKKNAASPALSGAAGRRRPKNVRSRWSRARAWRCLRSSLCGGGWGFAGFARSGSAQSGCISDSAG